MGSGEAAARPPDVNSALEATLAALRASEAEPAYHAGGTGSGFRASPEVPSVAGRKSYVMDGRPR
ncbi:hypothetical protein ACQEUU_06500 [Nonomuraea sp. CA-218870]|uniref:hypothetical protein n=1 Tax=Nonomuraea sp. CA-218870 TaxID=3239998 RepID=UPI003D8DE983